MTTEESWKHMLTGEGPATVTVAPPPPKHEDPTWQCECHNGFDVMEMEGKGWRDEPHIERCDTCQRYADDEAAGKAAEAEGVPGAWDIEEGLFYVCPAFDKARTQSPGGYWAGWVPGMIP